MNATNVVFRFCAGQSPRWQYYGVDLSVLGGAEDLMDARKDAREAIEFLLESDQVSVAEYLEWPALEGDDNSPAVFVRALRDRDCSRWNDRRDLAEHIINRLQQDPRHRCSFGDQTSATGDIIAFATLPDDQLGSVLASIGELDTVSLGMVEPEVGICWQTISGHLADRIPQDARSLESVGARPSMTVHEFMSITGSLKPSGSRTLTLA